MYLYYPLFSSAFNCMHLYLDSTKLINKDVEFEIYLPSNYIIEK